MNVVKVVLHQALDLIAGCFMKTGRAKRFLQNDE